MSAATRPSADRVRMAMAIARDMARGPRIREQAERSASDERRAERLTAAAIAIGLSPEAAADMVARQMELKALMDREDEST